MQSMREIVEGYSSVVGAIELTEATAGTVDVFLAILTSQLTRYDQNLGKREAKKGRTNIYRMGHLLKAVHDVRDLMKGMESNDDPDSLNRLKQAIKRKFTDIGPVSRTLKKIDAFIDTGKLPKLK